MARGGIVAELAEKYNISPSDVKRIIMKTAIQLAKQYEAQGLPWREALKRALTEVWEKVRETMTLPAIANY